jgi:hypothetical protein
MAVASFENAANPAQRSNAKMEVRSNVFMGNLSCFLGSKILGGAFQAL